MKSVSVCRRFIRTCLVVLLVHRCTTPTLAAPVLDQSYLPPGATTISDSRQYAQTFTSTLAGRLTQIDVVVGLVRGMDSTIEIRPVAAGIPIADDSRVLATIPLPEILIGTTDLTSFNLTPFSIVVKPGDVLAFTLRPGPSTSSIAFRLGDELLAGNPDYLAGALFRRNSNPPSQPFEIYPVRGDIKFQTFVDTAIPEPTSLMIVGFGLAIVGVLTLRQRQSSRNRSDRGPRIANHE